MRWTGRDVRWDDRTDIWRYVDNDEPCDFINARPCPRCKQQFTPCSEAHKDPQLHDPCLGHIDGALYACCGHDNIAFAYIHWEDGSTIRGRETFAAIGQKRPPGGLGRAVRLMFGRVGMGTGSTPGGRHYARAI